MKPARVDMRAAMPRLRQWLDTGAMTSRPHETVGAFNATKSAWDYNVAGFCSNPFTIPWRAHSTNKSDMAAAGELVGEANILVNIDVPCRRCPACLSSRRHLWRRRSVAEFAIAPRTWFGTVTFRPDARYVALTRAAMAQDRKAKAFDQLSPDEVFRATERETGKEITKYFKRLRKNTGSQFRYLLVAEEHKDGFPHYHVLIHETETAPVMKRELEAAWNLGFTQFRLVESPAACHYVTKYLAKSMLARVRASLDYGQGCELRYSQLAEQPLGAAL